MSREHHNPISRRSDFFPYISSGQYANMPFEQLDQLVPWGIDKYNLRDFKKYLNEIANDMGGCWDVFKGIKHLDICCGSFDGEGFYPWLPAIMSHLGAEVTGLDLGSQPDDLKNLYTHITFDIITLGENGLHDIAGIKNQQFNLITFLNTITSFVPSDVLTRMARDVGISLSSIQEKILKDIDKLLYPNGILYFDSKTKWQEKFIKKGNSLVKISQENPR